MKKQDLQPFVDENLSTYEIADKLGKAQTTIRYWLKKFDLSTVKKRESEDGRLMCYNCHVPKPKSEFYESKGRIAVYCKKCHNGISVKLQTQKKKDLIQYKGGKCSHCGIKADDENYVIFDFHHLDPSKKEMQVKVVNKGLETLKKEADKCILLCANCHRLEHRRLFKL